MPGWGFLSLLAGILALNAAVSVQVNKRVPEPYMDEIFHVPQAQQYCGGNLHHWDPMITTFPGLYLVAAPYAWALRSTSVLSGSIDPTEQGLHNGDAAFCSTQTLRSLNAFLLYAASVYVFYVAARHVEDAAAADAYAKAKKESPEKMHHSEGSSSSATPLGDQSSCALWKAAVFALYPLHWFFGFLFYTDVGSIAAVLAMYLCCLRRQYYLCALFAGVAVMMRQTNAVWAAFCLALSALQILEVRLIRGSISAADSPAEGEDSCPGLVDLVAMLKGLLHRAWAKRCALLVQLLPLAAVVAAFAVFVVLNKGVVVGDRSAHKFSPHLMQPHYFAAFTLILWSPFHLSWRNLTSLSHSFRNQLKALPAVSCLQVLGAVAGLAYVVKHFSLAHPYLLADNRHYTFYIWNRLINRTPWAKYSAIPLYLLGWTSILRTLRKAVSAWWTTGFIISTMLVLIPSPLIELRYFTVPATLLWLHMGIAEPRRLQFGLQLALFACLDAFTMFKFLHKPFKWENADGMQRFMW